ncbi:dipicolinate synthase subunit DpsA [Natribacillus halophilus]|uniref:Dipicolinate synthase subunit A n=1 Tax=Natribacillus halophilus TaxID=549003 RepID=A0A1G8PSU2_9BACI|nr:dipicolinate synthase subunit DpsA [Natribacillus halophilus]SDI94930.1 dipicolinate synthase subunit A [Natribacillus halophilus]
MEIIEHVAVIGGDRRQIQLVHTLQKNVEQISVVGFEKMPFSHANINACTLAEVPWEQLNAILFPMSGVKPDGKVEADYAAEPPKVTGEMLAQRSSRCMIFTGIMTEFFRQKNVVKDVVCWMERDDVAVYNSIPTAEGVLMLAMENTDDTIHGADVTVVGFGRCGLTIAELFKAVGAKVTVITDDMTEQARAFQAGHEVKELSHLPAALSTSDICVNTIPLLVITKEMLQQANERGYILDIASRPGGVDINGALQLGLNAQIAPGLPGKVAPGTAGDILAQVTLALMKSENKKGR